MLRTNKGGTILSSNKLIIITPILLLTLCTESKLPHIPDIMDFSFSPKMGWGERFTTRIPDPYLQDFEVLKGLLYAG